MTKRLIGIVALFAVSHALYGQTPSAKFSVGFDLLKTAPVFYDRGYILEPSLLYSSRNNLLIDLAVGFADIKKDTLYKNSKYYNKGYYIRAGAGTFITKALGQYNQVYFLCDLVYSDFTEKVDIRFREAGGPYYGDSFTTQRQSSHLFALEFQPGYRLPIMDSGFSFNFQLKLSCALSSPDQDYFPVYYAPGMGYVKPSKDAVKSSSLTVGASIRIVYKFLEIK